MVTILHYYSLDVPNLADYDPTGPFVVSFSTVIGVQDVWSVEYLFFIGNVAGVARELNRDANEYGKLHELRNYLVMPRFDLAAILDHINGLLQAVQGAKEIRQVLDACFIRSDE